MKTILKILLLLFFSSSSFAQTVAFQADRMNVLYIGVDNPITIVAENTDCSKIKVTTDNGKIEGKGCSFVSNPERYGISNITVSYKKGGKDITLVGVFGVRYLPRPIFKIGTGQRRLPAVALKNQEYVRAEFEDFPLDVHLTIDSFTVCTFSKDSAYQIVRNIGNTISKELKNIFASLKPEDEILFMDICSHKTNGEVLSLEPVLMRVY